MCVVCVRQTVETKQCVCCVGAGKAHKDTVPRLVELLEDEDRLVRESACLSLGYLKSSKAVDHIVDRWYVGTWLYSALCGVCLWCDIVWLCKYISCYRVFGLVVGVSASIAEDLGLSPGCDGGFHTSDLKTGTLVTSLPYAWCYRVSAGTGLPDVSVLWLGEVEKV